MEATSSIITEKEAYQKLIKFARKTKIIDAKGVYHSSIPQGDSFDIDCFYFWEDFLGYPQPEEVSKKAMKYCITMAESRTKTKK